MGAILGNRQIPVLVLLIAAVCIIQPVSADGGSVSIAYRGAGGIYIGNVVIFDGYNTAGNVTFLKITGPGLPAEGVPLMDLDGTPGTGNPVAANPDGSWQYDWDTSMVNDIAKMQTARYYITAVDLANPANSSVTSVMMEKPDFYFTVTPSTPQTGDYVQFVGTAQNNVESVRLRIMNSSGQVLHTFYVPVSATGYFNQGFHIDMPPGSYNVTLDSPTITASYQTLLQVVPPQTPTSNMTASPGTVMTVIPATPPVAGPGTGAVAVTSPPAGAPVSPAMAKGASPVPLPVLVPVLGVLIAVALVTAVSVRRSRS